MDIIIKVQEDMLSKIEKDLSSVENGDAKDVLRKGINQTAKQALNELTKKASQTYSAKGGARQYKQAGKIKNATKRWMTATITFKGGMREIKDYQASPLRISRGKDRPKLTKGKVLKNSKLTPLIKHKTKAFTAQFKSGHISVVKRNPTRMMKSNPLKEKLEVLLSPSIPHAIGGSKVYDSIQPQIGSNLEENVARFSYIEFWKGAR